ncbi:MAG: PhzF family phenazine biosynthesis protein, partial [Geminicoccaceae bacterium]|nr:PhzF family phenazine biosynthesis protein [Geminicoccaceae bacterium]
MARRFVITDVFTERRFAGNQLAVVVDAERLDQAAMQTIAREFNFSETTFVLPPEQGGDKRVRIFTPASEIPFAGHPTVGTALVLAELGEVRIKGDAPEIILEEGAGPVPVRLRRDGGR